MTTDGTDNAAKESLYITPPNTRPLLLRLSCRALDKQAEGTLTQAMAEAEEGLKIQRSARGKLQVAKAARAEADAREKKIIESARLVACLQPSNVCTRSLGPAAIFSTQRVARKALRE